MITCIALGQVRCRTNMEHIGQPRPDSGLEFQTNFSVVLSSLDTLCGGELRSDRNAQRRKGGGDMITWYRGTPG